MTESDSRGTTEIITTELIRVFEPVTTAAEDAGNGDFDALIEIFVDIGIDDAISEESLEMIADGISGAADASETLGSIVESLDEGSFDPSDAQDAVSAIKDVVDVIRNLDDFQVDTIQIDNLGTALLDLLLVRYLDKYHGQVYYACQVAGIIVEHDSKPDEFQIERIPELLSDPQRIPAEVFGWGTEEFRSMVVLHYLRGLVWEFGLPAEMKPPTDIGQEGEITDELTIPVLEATDQSGPVTTGVRIVPVPGNGGLPGLAVVPYGAVSADQAFGLGDDWTFNVAASGSLDDYGLVVRPESDPSLEPVGDDVGDVPVELSGEAGLSYNPEGEDGGNERALIGQPDGSRLAVQYVSLTASVTYDGDTIEFRIALPARGTLGADPSDFDGFLSKVLPKDGIFYNFDVTVGWSSESGLFFERGGSLEVSLPQQTTIGPVTMEEIYLSAGPGGGEREDSKTATGSIKIAGAASGSLELGPFTATVKRMGVEADVSFPEDQDGNLGPVDMEMGFKPPDGVGLSIDAGAVTGGGYLELDHENDRYAGVLQLKAGDLTINAVGLLTTDLPGQDDGFSLLLVITGEFPPVQLGMGFTLNGVGGLVGVNRMVKADPLGEAVRDGSMDSILFPENPIANSQRIISDLRAIFPPRGGTHVFGPIIRLGWGTPTLITADIGVILEVPTWRIVLLGRLSAVLPDEKAPLIELNLAVKGLLDPPNQRLEIDASLYDSRVLTWSLSGDMALRSNWGDNPRFVLSVGGFNPRFEPPDEFPELRRVRASLGPPSGNPKVEFYGYFAVTSNTVQAGAGVHLLAEAGPAKVEGRLQFDTLIKFDPFGFVIDILASIEVTIKGKGLSIRLDGTLKGPGPFEISGTIHIEILFITVSADVDVTLGSGSDDEGLPPAKIMPELTDALAEPTNWSAGRPGAVNNMVSLREVDPESETVLAHPLAEIGVRQTVVPLEFDLEKYGSAEPTGLTKFEIEKADVDGGGDIELGAKTSEQFAPAQYLKLSDQEKLDSEPFRAETAGQQMEHEGIYVGDDSSENVRTATLGFESEVIDRTNDNEGTPLSELGSFNGSTEAALSTLPEQVGDSLSEASAVAKSPLRTTGVERFRPSERELAAHKDQLSGVTFEISDGQNGAGTDGSGSTYVKRGGATPDEGGLSDDVSLGETGYVVASKATLERVEIPTLDEQPTSKERAKRAVSEYAEMAPREADELQVVESARVNSDSTATPSGDDDSEDGDDSSEFVGNVTLGSAGQQYLGGNQ